MCRKINWLDVLNHSQHPSHYIINVYINCKFYRLCQTRKQCSNCTSFIILHFMLQGFRHIHCIACGHSGKDSDYRTGGNKCSVNVTVQPYPIKFSLGPNEWFELLHHTVKSQEARNLQGGCCCKSPQETCVLWQSLDCTVGERVAGMKTLICLQGCGHAFHEGCVKSHLLYTRSKIQSGYPLWKI